jgi:hypothetical protein
MRTECIKRLPLIIGRPWHWQQCPLKPLQPSARAGRTCKVVFRPNNAVKASGSWAALNLGEVMLYDTSGTQLDPGKLKATLTSVCCDNGYPASNCINGA